MQIVSDYQWQLHQEAKVRRQRMAQAAMKPRQPKLVSVPVNCAVTRLVTHAEFERMRIQIEERRAAKVAAREKAMADAIAALRENAQSRPTKGRIIREVAEKHRLSVHNMLSASRVACLVAARREAAYRLRTELQLSWLQIAKAIGLKDHTSALHLYRSYVALLQAGEVA